MIQMPRSHPAFGMAWGGSSDVLGARKGWLVACMVLLHGCLYVEPAWEEPLNRPPELFRVNPPPPDLLFDTELERISVIASDPEGDELTFVFLPPPFVTGTETETNEDGVYVWTVDIPWTPEVEGRTVALTILDQDPEDRAEVTLEWQMVVP